MIICVTNKAVLPTLCLGSTAFVGLKFLFSDKNPYKANLSSDMLVKVHIQWYNKFRKVRCLPTFDWKQNRSEAQ